MNESERAVVRSAKETDINAITTIFAHEVRHGTASWSYDPPDVPEILDKMRRLSADSYPYLVATVQEQIAGYANVSAYRPREGYRFLVENSIYVSPDYRGRGIARQLMVELIAQCTERGYRQMIAVIGDSENTPSIELHRRLGFIQVGLLTDVGYKFDRWLDSVLMQLALGDGATSKPDR